MTIGRLDSIGDALVRLSVQKLGQEPTREVEAVLDTGFNGALALPADVLEALNLTQLGREELTLASGEKRYPRTYEAVVRFGGAVRSVEVIEAGEPLMGTALLWGYTLRIEYTAGGRVMIEELSAARR